MPHDVKGEVIEVGDEVIIRYKVKAVHQAEDYCNVDLETYLGMPPDFSKTNLSAINTKQMQKVAGKTWLDQRPSTDLFNAGH